MDVRGISRSVALFLSLALLVTACDFGSSGGEPAQAGIEGTPPTVDPSRREVSPAHEMAAADVCKDWQGLRHYSLATGVLTPGDAASLPVTDQWDDRGFWTVKPLGLSGLNGVIDDLTSEPTICDVEPSSALRGAIAEYMAAPDPSAAIDDLIAAVDAEAAPYGYSVGENSGGPTTSAVEASRSAIEAAAAAAKRGDSESESRLIQLANDIYESVGRKNLNTASREELLALAAGAQLLGLKELSQDASVQLAKLVKAEIKKMGEEFSSHECARQGDRWMDEFAKMLAIGNSVGLSDHPESADPDGFYFGDYTDLINTWAERQVAAASGIDDPKCKGHIFEPDMQFPPGLEGEARVVLVSCDDESWEGVFTGNWSFDTADGRFDGEITGHLDFPGVGIAPPSEKSVDVPGSVTWKVQGDGFSGGADSGSVTGSATFSIKTDSDGSGIPFGKIVVDFGFVNLSGQMTVDGETVPMFIPAKMGAITGVDRLGQAGEYCNKNA